MALSGGADSAVLAWAVLQDGREARAAHVHHGWPGSDRMEAAAEWVADRIGIKLTTVRVDVSGLGSPEAEARRARYAALEHMQRDGELIATGHTLTDQAETVLGNLIWGSGLDGLKGIHRRRNALVRPMLEVTRAETRELAGLLGIPFVDDPANHDPSFRRVRLRRTLATWERQLAPGIGARLAGLSRLVEADLELLERLSAEVRVDKSGGAVRFSAPVLRTMPRALAARVIRRALRAAGQGYPGTFRDVEAVFLAAHEGIPGWVRGGLPVVRSGSYVQIGLSRPQGDGPLSWDVVRPLRWGPWTWQARESPGRPDAYPHSSWHQVFDASIFAGVRPVVRTAAGDDRIAIHDGHKRVADAMREVGIPEHERSGWPLLEVDGRVIWIPGVRRAYAGWVTHGTISHVVMSATREMRWRPVGY